MRVKTPEESLGAHWLVVNGLHIGPAGELLDLADAILEEDQKALPLAGAAARLEELQSGSIRPRMIKGRVFCGLPLPRETPLALHVNGFFELDTSRDWLQLNTESVGLHGRRRQQWNHQLIRHGVATATTELLDALVDEIDDEEIEDLYSLWPTLDAGLEGLLPGFGEAVYERAWTEGYQFIRVPTDKPDEQWQSPRDVMLLSDEWHDSLISPLAADEWRYLSPLCLRMSSKGSERLDTL